MAERELRCPECKRTFKTSVKQVFCTAKCRRQARPISSEYNTWRSMIYRCYSDKSSSWKYYGARGIKVCERWRTSFSDFLSDMGPKPDPNLSLERKDNNGDYTPKNCIWATSKEQNSNRRNTKARLGNRNTKDRLRKTLIWKSILGRTKKAKI